MKPCQYYATIGAVYDYLIERHRQTGRDITFPAALEGLRQEGRLSSTPPPVPVFRSDMDVEMFYTYLRALRIYADPILPQASTYLSNPTIQESELFQEGRDVFVFLNMPYQVDLMHYHNFFEISYVLSGSCTFLFEGETARLSAGDVCIVSPLSRHSLPLKPGCICLSIVVRRSTVDSLFGRLLAQQDLLSMFFRNSLYEPRRANYILLKTGSDQLTFQTAQQLTYETNLTELYSNSCSASLLDLFLARSLRAGRNAIALYRYEGYSRKDFDFALVLQYIQQNYRTVTLSDLAEAFCFDEAYLSKLIRKNMGQKFTDVLRAVKMNRAMEYLMNTPMKISKIAEAVGYDSADHFSRIFRRVYGISPQQYRLHGPEYRRGEGQKTGDAGSGKSQGSEGDI